MAIKKIKLPGMTQPVDIGTTWTNVSNKPDLVTSEEATAYMQKGVDYVTAGQKSGTTLGRKATAEGQNITASGDHSHAEGFQTTASGASSHAEGQNTTASKSSSHAEGSYTTASGSNGSHAEGYTTTASGSSSHAEGAFTTASGAYSHAEGRGTTANHRSQHVFGEYNIADNSTEAAGSRGNYVEIVGNGTNINIHSNARTLDWSGNEVLAGKLTVGANPTENMDVTTKQYVDNNFIATALKGASNGVAQLDAYGKVPTSQLPSYVDDVIEGTMSNGVFTPTGNGETANPDPIATGESGKIYVDTNTNKTYRWGGTTFVEISESLALGETSSTAYRGDLGKAAYDTAAAALPKTGGTMSGVISMGNNKIINLADGTTGSDAATVHQLRSFISEATATIATNATSVEINFDFNTYSLINAYATMGDEIVYVDIETDTTAGKIIFSTAQSPASAITCHVLYRQYAWLELNI